MGNRKGASEIQGVDGARIKNFPFSSLRLLGFLQVGIGVTCLVFGIVDLFLYLYVDPDYENETLSSLTIACLPIWCGLWFLVSGAMGTCMSLEQKTTLSYFKNTYMVLSILCGILFAPVLLGVEIYIVKLRSDKADHVYEWIFPMILAFFAINEIICATITASICCCCSPIQQAKVRVLYTRDIDEYRRPSEYKPRLSTPEIFYTKQSRLDHERDREQKNRRPTHDYNNYSSEDEGFGSARRPRGREDSLYDKRKSHDYEADRRKSRAYDDDRRQSHAYEDDRRRSRDFPEARRRSNEDEDDRRRSLDDIIDEDEVDFDGKKPRVSMSAESPVMPRSRPETYDSQYRRLKQLALPDDKTLDHSEFKDVADDIFKREDEDDRRRSLDDIIDEDEVDFDGKKPRVSMSAESPVMPRSRPETYDSQYRRLKQLALPGNPDHF